MNDSPRTQFKEYRDGEMVFTFVCPGCGAEGELGIPRYLMYHVVDCPEGCGARFVPWKPNELPALRCVVCPMPAPRSVQVCKLRS